VNWRQFGYRGVMLQLLFNSIQDPTDSYFKPQSHYAGWWSTSRSLHSHPEHGSS